MKNVLVPLPPTTWGGLHAFSQNIAPALAELGWRQVLAVPRGVPAIVERLRASDMAVVETDMHRFRFSIRETIRTLLNVRRDIEALCSIGKAYDVNLVQAVGAHHYHGLLTARQMRLPLVWQLHSDILPNPVRGLAARVIKRHADVIMTNGRRVAKSFFGPDPSQTPHVVFYAPVDPQTFFSSPERRELARAELDMPQNAVVVGTVGNRVAQKDHALLLQVAGLTVDLYPSLRYVVLGASNSGYAATYQREVLESVGALNDRYPGYVSILDPAQRVAELLNAFDVFILTSRSEGVPISLFEAGSTGLPAIATDVGSVADIIENEGTGLLVSRDAHASHRLAHHVRTLFSAPDRRKALGQALQQRISSDFSLAKVAQVHADAYESALAARCSE